MKGREARLWLPTTEQELLQLLASHRSRVGRTGWSSGSSWERLCFLSEALAPQCPGDRRTQGPSKESMFHYIQTHS